MKSKQAAHCAACLLFSVLWKLFTVWAGIVNNFFQSNVKFLRLR